MAGKRGNKGKGKKMLPSGPTEPRERTPSPAPSQVEEEQQAEQEPPSMATSEETSQPSSRSSSRSQSPSVRPSKKAKTFTDLTTNQEDDMASWLEVNELIYNKKLNAYKDFRKKDILWELKAAELDKDTAVLKTWYRSIRTRYTRLEHTKSGDGASELTERDRWILQNFAWLKPHMVEVKRKTTVSVSNRYSKKWESSTHHSYIINSRISDLHCDEIYLSVHTVSPDN